MIPSAKANVGDWWLNILVLIENTSISPGRRGILKYLAVGEVKASGVAESLLIQSLFLQLLESCGELFMGHRSAEQESLQIIASHSS